ncbi:preprotein translocase subunit SecG [Candidatus Xianfuyuplasma coldseepsis]|uniref:Protein-export membrane protein SecG n=1 Tax=Candidatus Xianfuyuplasma coldseepsis TaxID=2782163 RepID=A0A7L7KNG9_9MOLU|nr:preprotein translocase subunit SecG [Xianfuyuplasma coldseepsis]QMS84270.1 preprotein translocase subunit SecG [Xianfuyuplasma coldseepsis]
MRGIDIVLLILSLLLITIVVLQSSKDNAANAFSGEKSELFNNQKQRGFELIMNITTLVVSVFFIVTSILALAL